MIKVILAAEPAEFNDRVRLPGANYLASVPIGQTPDPASRPYWRRILLSLHKAYSGICAYTCHWIPYDVGSDTVEHFIPKAVDPSTAYEWSNYRLVCGRLNGRKGAHQDVIDPFLVEDEMFHLEFPSLLVRRGICSAKQSHIVDSTIKRLGLNEERCILMRQAFINSYLKSEVTLAHIKKNAPFLARELGRQRLSKSKLRKMFGN
jgi:hypothetical protein